MPPSAKPRVEPLQLLDVQGRPISEGSSEISRQLVVVSQPKRTGQERALTQAFSHVMLIKTARNRSHPHGPAEQRKE